MVNADAVRGQVLLEESREAVVVLDENGVVVTASRRARQSLGIREGDELSSDLLQGERALVVPYAVDGRQERLVYLSETGDLAAYEEFRSGFTAAVSHELRTPLARLLSLLELASLPGEDVPRSSSSRGGDRPDRGADRRGALPGRARVRHGVVSLGAEPVLPVLRGRCGARGAGCAGRRHAARRGRPGCDRRGAAADAPRRRQEPGRERDPLRRPRRQRDALGPQVGRRGGAQRGRRRRRRRPGRSPAAVRALLPRRPLPRVARHRASGWRS